MTISHKLDCNIKKNEWKKYLKRYKKCYRCFHGEIGIWSIKCKYGFIQPYSIIEKKLVAILTYKSQRGINYLLKRLQIEKAPAFEIVQRGDFEVSICFYEKDIEYFVELLKFGKVWKPSQEFHTS